MRLGQAAKAVLLGLVLVLVATLPVSATEFHGQVTFGGLPVPGAQAVVTATQGDKTVTAITNDQGLFTFPDLADGAWAITISMTGFAPIKESITVAANSPIPVFELKIQSLEQIRAEAKPVKVEPGAAPAVATAVDAGATTAAASTDKSAPGKKKGETQQAANGAPNNAAPAPPPTQEASSQAPDGFLINGSVNNAATSQFSLAQAFGNSRNRRSLYNYGLMFQFDSSKLDANNWYPVGGVSSPKAPYNNFVAGIQFQGPLKIPHLLPAFRAPTFYIGYNRTQTARVTTQPALVPTSAAIGGDLSALANPTTQPIFAPAAGLSSACLSAGAVPGQQFAYNGVKNVLPPACISSVALNLLTYYPAPNLTGSSAYNYQIPLSNDQRQDSMQARLQKSFGNKDNINGSYAFTRSHSTNPSIFIADQQGNHFTDTQDNLGQNVNVNWYHRFTQRLSGNLTYSPSRQRIRATIQFQNGQNVSQAVGITGNLQDPANFGPPALSFSQSAIAGLRDGSSLNNRNQTQAIGVNMQWNRFRHNVQFGGDFRRQEWNYFQQSNPRGTLSFTGAGTQAASGSAQNTGLDFADFLLGLPDTSQIAFGNADKYLRQSVYDLFVQDDFRVSPELSLNLGLRWEYGAPITETKNRLVNLDFAPGFAGATPVLATNPSGSLSGQRYPTSLLRPDRIGFAPTIGVAWRPISGSSLLVRAGYGLYHDTSVYQATALAMANQTPGLNAPWSSTSLNVSARPTCPLPIANPFSAPACALSTSAADTFAVDPNFRVGYAQVWTLSVQRDLPAALQMLATYTGIKGTRGVQEILPNTYPVGATDPCPSCPKGYYYRSSNGNSTREAGSMQLRRRLRAGFLASALYTYSKSLDDDYSYGGATNVASGNTAGSPQVAQDWRHPEAQRGLSTFDQRHTLGLQLQYTTGVGLGGHALLSGWRGAIYKEWTVLANINVASGLPQTPIYFAAVPGTAYTGIIRANYNGGAIHQIGATATGVPTYLNPNAFGVPTPGQWGTAPRNFITGPSQFGLNASMQRGFRLHDRYNLTAQIDANNVLNHVTLSNWSTAVGSTQFGTAAAANGMRSVSITLRMRY